MKRRVTLAEVRARVERLREQVDVMSSHLRREIVACEDMCEGEAGDPFCASVERTRAMVHKLRDWLDEAKDAQSRLERRRSA